MKKSLKIIKKSVGYMEYFAYLYYVLRERGI